MATEASIRRYRNGYAKLLRLYPKTHRQRFGEGMEQTFNDLCRERVNAGKGLFGLVLWLFVETSVGIIRENLVAHLMRNKSVFHSARVTVLILLIPFFGNLFVMAGTGLSSISWSWVVSYSPPVSRINSWRVGEVRCGTEPPPAWQS